MGNLASSSGDAAAWVGAIGTWVIGGVAALIAFTQFNNARFRPKVLAFLDLHNRLVIQVANRGTGASSLGRVDALGPSIIKGARPRLDYRWEIAGRVSDSSPLPFLLPGLAAAQLVLLPAEDDATPDIVSIYFSNRSVDVEVIKIEAIVAGSTTIPGVRFSAEEP
jgi:hypothetical protein